MELDFGLSARWGELPTALWTVGSYKGQVPRRLGPWDTTCPTL